MRRLVFITLVSSLLLAIMFQLNISHVKAAIHQGDLVITGNDIYIIENQRFDINGSIIVEQNATLILRNAIVNFTQTTTWQYNMSFQNPVNGKPRLQSENATISSDYAFFIRFYGNSSADSHELDSPIGILEARDYSGISIINSTIRYLYCFDNSLVNVSDSTVYSCRTGQSSSVNFSNCGISYVELFGSSVVTISDSSIYIWLQIQSSSVNCSLTDLTTGFTNSWNYQLNCSVAIGAEGYASDLIVRDTYISLWYFVFRGSSNVTIHNSTMVYLESNEFSHVDVINSNIDGVYAYSFSHVDISNSTLIFIKTYSLSRANILDSTADSVETYHFSQVWLINSTVNTYDIQDQSRICVNWYLDVYVDDSLDQNVPLANVTAYYPNATMAEMKLTDLDGWTRLTLLEKMMNATGEYPVGNYTVEATYEVHSNETMMNMTGNQQATLTLESFIIPEFSPLITFPLFITLTLLATFLYNRRRFK